MEAIILVGGLGTRLGELTKTTPKPMLPIRNVPFLERLLVHLKKQGISRVILAVGYKREVVESYFCKVDDALPEIVYSVEKAPLGTGGAIAQALSLVKGSYVFVLNGDSYLDLDYSKMMDDHLVKNADITIASYFISPADRYGVMEVSQNGEVVSFQEKGAASEGLINGGIYLLNVAHFSKLFISLGRDVFSFEESVLSNQSLGVKKYHYPTRGYFLDIGVPSDYKKAQLELFI